MFNDKSPKIVFRLGRMDTLDAPPCNVDFEQTFELLGGVEHLPRVGNVISHKGGAYEVYRVTHHIMDGKIDKITVLGDDILKLMNRRREARKAGAR